jgi:hypothetical protein
MVDSVGIRLRGLGEIPSDTAELGKLLKVDNRDSYHPIDLPSLRQD